MKREYKLAVPKFFEDEEVYFYPHNKNYTIRGIINRVETHYSKDVAYHIYSMRVDGWNRHQYIGEKNIVEKI